jgi:integrase
MTRRAAAGRGTCFERVSGGWQASWGKGKTPDGRRHRITAYGPTEAAAWEALDKRRRELDPRPATLRKAGHTLTSWSTVWLAYLQNVRCVKESTLDIYRSKLRLHVLPALGDVLLSEMDHVRVDIALGRWAAAGMSPAMRQMCFARLRSMVAYALRKGELEKNPLARVETPRTPRTPRRQLWDDSQRARFMEWVQLRAPRHLPFYATALCTGMRLGEMLGLQWGQVRDGFLRVDRQLNYDVHGAMSAAHPTREPKTPSSVREVPVSTHLAALLANARGASELKGDADFVFPATSGRPQRRSNVLMRLQASAAPLGPAC